MLSLGHYFAHHGYMNLVALHHVWDNADRGVFLVKKVKPVIAIKTVDNKRLSRKCLIRLPNECIMFVR